MLLAVDRDILVESMHSDQTTVPESSDIPRVSASSKALKIGKEVASSS